MPGRIEPSEPRRDCPELGQHRPVVEHERRDLAFRVDGLERRLVRAAAGHVDLLGLIRTPDLLQQDVDADGAGVRTPIELHVWSPDAWWIDN